MDRWKIENWNTDQIGNLVTAMNALGARLEGYFDDYANAVVRINGNYWEGKAADAASDRAHNDRKTVLTFVDEFEALTRAMTASQGEIAVAIRNAREEIAKAEQDNGFHVAQDLTITDPKNRTDATTDSTLRQIQQDLNLYASQLENEDNQLTKTINDARDGLRVSFTSPQTLGADQARTDSAALASGHMNPEEYRRLIVAGRLSPQQLNDLRAGHDVHVSAAQLEYINQLSRSMDGKSPQEIQQMMDKMPPDARQALGNCFQIGSSAKVTASVNNDPNLPNGGNGGFNLLPKKMQDSLTRSDLTGQHRDPVTYDPFNDPLWVGVGNKKLEMNGVADNTAIAKIAGNADARYRSGSDLNSHLLDVGAKYLDVEHQYQAASHGNIGGTGMTVDGRDYTLMDGQGGYDREPAGDIFRSVGDDKAAVHRIADVTPDGQKFIKNVMTYNWTDHGDAASNLFKFDGHSAIPDNTNDPASVQYGRHQGSIMSAVGQYMSTDTAVDDLKKINGTNLTFGQANPALAQSIAHTMTPYIQNIGEGSGNNYGFDSSHWATGAKHDYHGAKNVFQILDANDAARQEITAGIERAALVNEVGFAHNPTGRYNTHELDTAGRLIGLNDAALRDSNMEHGFNDRDAKIESYKQKSAAYDAVTNIGTVGLDKVPGMDEAIGDADKNLNKALGMGGDNLKSAIIGSDPKNDPVSPTPLAAHDFQSQDYAILSNADIPDNLKAQHPELYDSSGNLKSWNEINAGGTAVTDQVPKLVQEFGHVDTDSQMGNAYRPVVETDPSTEKPKGKK
ncbi:MAG: hypothetical protein J2P18_06580 [Nocardia sp.]|nr:hypothetical protein [Nocardia sp.]